MNSGTGYMRNMQDSTLSDGLSFMKMHGAGNNFVIFDSRGRESVITSQLARGLGDRHRGVGFDQLAEITDGDGADFNLGFWNRDGSTAGACGNATRCVADYLLAEGDQSKLTIKVWDRVLAVQRNSDGQIWVNMGQPQLTWQSIPLAPDTDPKNLPLAGNPDAVGIGNPHCVFFVNDLNQIDVSKQGAIYEVDPIFPKSTNVEFVQVLSNDHLRMRVWERGTGITLACGSGACASLVAASRRNLCARKVSIDADGGTLGVDWRSDGVWLTGPTAHVFDAVITSEFLRSI